MPDARPDLCVIGGGVAGHALAFAAAALGARCTLVDPREHLGSGQAADLAEAMLFAHAAAHPPGAPVGLTEFRRRLGLALAARAPVHAAARLASAGVALRRGTGAFVDARTLRVGMETIRARRFVIATGTSAPPPGWAPAAPRLLRPADLLLGDAWPAAIAIVGRGPVALAWAQALARLGTRTALWLEPGATAGLDPELLAPVLAAVRADGVAVTETGAPLAAPPDTAVPVMILGGGVAATASLALEAAAVATRGTAPVVDAGFRTSNRRVLAIGDVLDGPRPPIAAQVGAVLRASLLRVPARSQPPVVVVPTRPALVQLGALAAVACGPARRVLRHPLADLAAGTAPGLVKIVADARGRIEGVGLVADAAAEAAASWALAMGQGVSLGAMAGLPAIPGTLAEAGHRAALGVLTARLRGPWIRRLIAAVRWLP